jgi:hypothetical protein
MAAKKSALAAFGVAKTGVAATKSASIHKEASVTDDVKAAVDKLVKAKATIKVAEADQQEAEELIIGHVKPQIDQLAYGGDFVKSLIVPGETASAMYTQSDRFSVPQDADGIGRVQELTGELFDEMFELKTVLTVKPDVISSEEKLGKLVKALEKAGIDATEYFDNVARLVAKDGLDQKQYKLPASKLEDFRRDVRPSKPALKARA